MMWRTIYKKKKNNRVYGTKVSNKLVTNGPTRKGERRGSNKNHGKAAGALEMLLLLLLLLFSWTDVHACIRHQKKNVSKQKNKEKRIKLILSQRQSERVGE